MPSKDARALADMADEARAFLLAQKWCGAIEAGHVAVAIAGVMAVFHFRIRPRGSADPEVWVIVGDIPPAYMDVESCRDPVAAVHGYVGAMRDWVTAVRSGGRGVDDLIPVHHRNSLAEIPHTPEYADLLSSRLDFTEQHIIPEFRRQLEAGEFAIATDKCE